MFAYDDLHALAVGTHVLDTLVRRR